MNIHVKDARLLLVSIGNKDARSCQRYKIIEKLKQLPNLPPKKFDALKNDKIKDKIREIIQTLMNGSEISLDDKIKKEIAPKIIRKEKSTRRMEVPKDGNYKPGILLVIEKCLKNASPNAPTSKANVLEVLKAAFPDRNENSLKNSITTFIYLLIKGRYKKSKNLLAQGNEETGYWMKLPRLKKNPERI